MAKRLTIKVIGVVGAGQMGAGIAQVAAAAKLPVVLADIDDSTLGGGGLKSISSSLSRFVSKGSLTQKEADATLARVKTTTALSDLHDADLVIEAVSENEDLKRRIFGELDRVVKPSGILASNTSSISITRIASYTQRPFQVVGMLFRNFPPPLMGRVEITRGPQTRDAIFKSVYELVKRLAMTASCPQVHSGFVEAEIWMPIINEAFYALQKGVASADDIDTGVKLGTIQPMGPLAFADLIGLDTCLLLLRGLYWATGDSKYRPCPLLVRYVDAGRRGRESGRGVYYYPQ